MKFDNIKLPSNRRFGLFFSLFFIIFNVYLYQGIIDYKIIILGIITTFTILATIFKPNILDPFNKIWMYFGFILGKIVSPIVLAIIFYILISPIAIIIKLMGRDELLLKVVPKDSYWKSRNPKTIEPESFKNQY